MKAFEQRPGIIDPAAAVEEIRMRVMQMGANDSEMESFNTIIAKLKGGGYENPEEAIEDAQKILDSKQDYH
ncbi:MAG: hypothetical protein Q8P45_02515 [Candidatus Harrisonbacteria bacterium]|nr:hypothetical protein [Candidatus Harrisonbacteria bacterium]